MRFRFIFTFILFAAFTSVGFLAEAQTLFCKQLFNKTIQNSLYEITKNQSDFYIGDVMQLGSYRENGCSVVCATNLVQGLRLQEGRSIQSPYQQLQNIMSIINPNFQPNSFGTHGTGGTLQPLHVGSLKRFIETLIQKNNLEKPYVVSAYQKAEHAPYFQDHKEVTFIESLPTQSTFRVNQNEAKIILVEVNDKSRPYPQGFLTAHFYAVAGFNNGIVTLHDPLVRGKLFRFELIPFTSGAFKTMELRPLDPTYKLDRAFPDNLHYMVNGYVSVVSH